MYQETDRESIEQWESDIANSQIISFLLSIYYFQAHSWQYLLLSLQGRQYGQLWAVLANVNVYTVAMFLYC